MNASKLPRRLCVVAILSLDGPGTTLVYPQTRKDSSFEYSGRKCVRATDVNNLVLGQRGRAIGREGERGRIAREPPPHASTAR